MATNKKDRLEYTFEYDEKDGFVRVYDFKKNVLESDPKKVDTVLGLYKDIAHTDPIKTFSNYADPNNDGLTRFVVENKYCVATIFVYETQNEYCKDIMNVLNTYTKYADSKIKEKEKISNIIKNIKIGIGAGAILLAGVALAKSDGPKGYYNVEQIEQDIKDGKYDSLKPNYDPLDRSKEISEQKRKEEQNKIADEVEKMRNAKEEYEKEQQNVQFDDWNDPYTQKVTGAEYNGDVDGGTYLESNTTAYEDAPKVKTLTNN